MNVSLAAVLEFAPPLVFAALGGVISERAGVVNIGLEGMMRFGAFAAATGALFSGSPWIGLGCGAAAGALAAGVHALLSLRFRADQVVSGIALNLVALASGAFAGLGGAALSVGILGQFDARMPAGQGFMALAAMVFGRWTPLGAAGAAFFFAAGGALQRELSFLFHAADLRLHGVFLALPYALTLLVLAVGAGRIRAPAADGIPYDPEDQT